MSQDPRLDEKYFNSGVYYDYEACDYYSLVRLDNGVGFVRPQAFDTDPFHEMTTDEYAIEDIAGTLETDLREVSEQAVENPSSVISNVLDNVRTDKYGLSGPSQQEMIDLGYARRQTKIIEDE